MDLSDGLQISNQFTFRRKWKDIHNLARQVCPKYKKQRPKTYYGFSLIDLHDSSDDTLPAESDITQNDLFQLCLEHLKRNQKTTNQIEEISELTADQTNDESDEWI